MIIDLLLIAFGLGCVYAAFMLPLWAVKYGWWRWWQR